MFMKLFLDGFNVFNNLNYDYALINLENLV